MNQAFSIDDLNLVDDLGVSVDQNDYVDVQEPLPLAAGRYGFRIAKWDYARDRKGQPNANGELPLQLQDGKYPIIDLIAVDIVAPDESVRKNVYLYHSVRTKPFPRVDRTTGQTSQANAFGDLLRSADTSVSFSGLQEGVNVMKSLIAQGAVFHARFDWTAADRDAIKAELESIRATATANGQSLQSEQVKAAEKQVYKTYTRRGMKNFRNEAGVIVPFMPASTEGADPIKARVEIVMDGFIPASQVDKVKLGPIPVR